MNKKTILSVLLVIGPILLGFGIYFSCRSSSLLYYQWIPFKNLLGLGHAKDYAWGKCFDILGTSPVAQGFIFSAPAAMFAFSLTYYIKSRYFRKALASLERRQKIAAFIITVVFIAYVPERMQQAGAVSGRFDIADVITAGFATLLALYIP